MKTQKIVPCLWFNNNIEEAVKLYTSLFKNSEIVGTTHYGEAAAKASGQTKGSVMTEVFKLEGQEFLALNGGPYFKHTQALSLLVACESEKEIDTLWENLSKDGKTFIELDQYPFAEKYGWCADPFGVSWQLILSNRKQKISPALLFTQEQAKKAEEAMKYYTSLFASSKIESIARDDKTGAILHARFNLLGQEFVALESPIEHDFTFSPAISFMVNCDTQDEIDELWTKLSADPEAEQCGWLKDKFGISWQIVPKFIEEVMLKNDPEQTNRLMAAVVKMKKLDLHALKQAVSHGLSKDYKNVIEKQIELMAPIERVWQALADYREFGKWFRVNLKGPFVPGKTARGNITYPGYEHYKWEAVVQKMDSENLFSFTWHPYAIDTKVDYTKEPPTLVEFKLKKAEYGTTLTLTESGFDQVPEYRREEAYRMNEGGWTEQMKNIKEYLNI